MGKCKTDYQEVPALTLRDRLAATLVGITHAEEDRPSEWSIQFIVAHGAAPHDGDCTDQIHSCLRCEVDTAKRDADAILALVTPQLVDRLPKGCICPGTLAAGCHGPMCPRRPLAVN